MSPHPLLDPDGITRLYRRHARSLLVFFQRRVDDPEGAVDLLADTFARVVERREQFRGSTEAELSGWLWRIAQSELGAAEHRIDQERRGRSAIAVERRALSDREIERIDDLAGMRDLRAAVSRHLAELPAETREAVLLHVVEERPYAEVAQRLGLRPDAARARVSRGLRILGRLLRDDRDAWERDR
ncbi:RNA polymerase ECF-subfamily sigma factor [Patulibacter medicamentivorans]|uniref:RNA polymerase ECF-subfamily sigma factor n=1 Tax=Patulibacter medicamentivorans TaxID=1097667 RepID=H0E3A8_9ACTN|nr:RNA polymerase sigma factor [Patulibacter medicamentivorans]EHN11844.1 RNA polymerase ECF-subfamily sigma factor [Patulibacter medicamentivorans]